MARRLYARRYAQAVFEIALERKELDRWQSDLGKIASVGDDVEAITILQSPRIRFDDKARLLAKRLPAINPSALNLAYLLVTRGRLDVMGGIGTYLTSRLMRQTYHQFSIPSRSKKCQNSNILVTDIFHGHTLVQEVSKVFHFIRRPVHHLLPTGLNYKIGKTQKFIYIWLEISTECGS